MNAVQSLLARTLKAEFVALMELLDAYPAELLGKQPQHGHSAAWHALHIMDWTRCVIQPGLQGVNPALTYGYLGFEDADWTRAVTGPTLVEEHDAPEHILKSVRQVFDEALKSVRTAPEDRFEPDALWTTLKRPRPVLDGLTYHLRHTAYHRGQVTLVLKELA
ncbi:hypothetical protein DAETH_31300 [Deinococcus aetherius]|uniref:DinB-like domain-containing protein n=1 Tax=Deinococcus aetherius TaxID=200252 RepID=A0ABN6RLF1_9DEIO|nr:DinB family protein [Deinococcus aetherius]BDP43161.1 hypothetical protein DAETH_31300 [Deinococcus aetherius]